MGKKYIFQCFLIKKKSFQQKTQQMVGRAKTLLPDVLACSKLAHQKQSLPAAISKSHLQQLGILQLRIEFVDYSFQVQNFP